jgi:hypothetical protein
MKNAPRECVYRNRKTWDLAITEESSYFVSWAAGFLANFAAGSDPGQHLGGELILDI